MSDEIGGGKGTWGDRRGSRWGKRKAGIETVKSAGWPQRSGMSIGRVLGGRGKGKKRK